MGFAHLYAISCLKDDAECTEFRYTKATPTFLAKVRRNRHPMLIDGGSEICVMRKDVAGAMQTG
jgi:hypothetical protein